MKMLEQPKVRHIYLAKASPDGSVAAARASPRA
jgi:hypothetical protein